MSEEKRNNKIILYKRKMVKMVDHITSLLESNPDYINSVAFEKNMKIFEYYQEKLKNCED